MVTLVTGSAAVVYTDLTGGGSKTLFSLPAKSVLLYLNANIDVAFNSSFALTCAAPDATVLLTVPDTTIVGIADKEFDKNAWINSLTAVGNVTAIWVGAGGGVWVAGGNLNTPRDNFPGCGIQTAALCFGGDAGPIGAPANTNITEEYDGAAWAVGGVLSAAKRGCGGAGAQDSGLCIGGYAGITLDVTEEYDGAAWGIGGALITARVHMGNAGTQIAGLCATGARDPFPTPVLTSEEYDGAAWAGGGNVITARWGANGCGTQTAALCVAGLAGGVHSVFTEEYDGAAWAAGGNLTTARWLAGCQGSQNAGLCEGGDQLPANILNSTEEYNGAAWAAGGNLITGRANPSHAGTFAAGLCAGGVTAAIKLSSTEEYAGSSTLITRGRMTVRYAYIPLT